MGQTHEKLIDCFPDHSFPSIGHPTPGLSVAGGFAPQSSSSRPSCKKNIDFWHFLFILTLHECGGRSLSVRWVLTQGILPEEFGGGVQPASQNPYPICDQNLRFFLPYLWPDQKFDTLFMTVASDNPVALNNFWRAFVYGLIDNDEKVASTTKQTQFKTRVQNHTLFKTTMVKSIPCLWPKRLKKPSYFAHIREYLSPGLSAGGY